MTGQSQLLPDAFAELEALVGEWAWPTAAARTRHRLDNESDPPLIRQFYDQMLPHMAPAIRHLNNFPLAALPPPERLLFDLVLMFAEISHFVELRWRRWYDPSRFVETRLLPYSDHAIPGSASQQLMQRGGNE